MRSMNAGIALGALAMLGALSPAAVAQEEEEHWRLLVADHSEPIVRVFDIDGDAVASFDTKGPATLSIGPSGTVVYAIQRETGLVQAIDSGISFDDHGDHADIDVEEPRLLDYIMEGGRPTHFVVHDGRIAVFFDGEGVARVYSESGLAAGDSPLLIETDSPHHGVAVTVGDHVVISIPNAADPDALPVGVRIVDREGVQAGSDHPCPDLHGEAASGNLVAVACATGLLLVQPQRAGPPSVDFLPYGANLPEGKSTTLIGGVGLQYFVGNYGADAIVIIEPADAAFTRVSLPTRRVHFAVDRQRPQTVYVFTEDGRLHTIDILSGDIVRSASLTQPYSMDGHWSDPRPRIAVAGEHILVSDPLAGRVRVLESATLEVVDDIAVEGVPFDIVAVGGHGEKHGHDHRH